MNVDRELCKGRALSTGLLIFTSLVAGRGVPLPVRVMASVTNFTGDGLRTRLSISLTVAIGVGLPARDCNREMLRALM